MLKHKFQQFAKYTFKKQQLFSSKSTTKRFFNAYAKQPENIFNNVNFFKAVVGGTALLGTGYILLHTLNKPVTYQTQDGITVTKQYGLPRYVQDYLSHTYEYVAAGATVTAGAAYSAFKLGFAERVLSLSPLKFFLLFGGGSIVALIGTQAIDMNQSPVLKHATFGLFNVLFGLSLSPLAFLSPSVLIRAGIYTLGITAALSWTAMNAEQETFLYLGGPLMTALTLLVLTQFANMIMPARFARTLQYTEIISLYGGLALFSLFMLYDTQVIMKHAQLYEQRRVVSEEAAVPKDEIAWESEELLDAESATGIVPSASHFATRAFPRPDYINESIRIYLNMINIFVRLVAILTRNQDRNNRKR